MRRSIFSLFFLLTLSVLGAEGQPRKDFPYVAVPYYIATDDGAGEAEWLALNFWNDYDFDSCSTKYEPSESKRGFVTFITALYSTTPAISVGAIEKMMSRAAVNEESYWYFLEMTEAVLYDPSSSMRNDLLWEPVVRHAIGSSSPLDEPSKERYRSMLKLVSRNQEGTAATDFTYTLADGSQGRLYDISAPYTIIFFYNPDCGECARTKAQMEASGYLDMLHNVGLVKVLALYPDGDVSAWRKALPQNPEWWISAYDKEQKINREGLYDLKAIPTLYLLDAQKRVIMKDPLVEVLISFLASEFCG